MDKDQVRKLGGISQRTRVSELREGLINRKTSGHRPEGRKVASHVGKW